MHIGEACGALTERGRINLSRRRHQIAFNETIGTISSFACACDDRRCRMSTCREQPIVNVHFGFVTSVPLLWMRVHIPNVIAVPHACIPIHSSFIQGGRQASAADQPLGAKDSGCCSLMTRDGFDRIGGNGLPM